LDEPISNMDPQSEKEFIHALKNYLEQDPRRTLVVVTHQTSMLQLVEHMIVLNEGRVFMSGEKSAVLAKLAATAHPPTNSSPHAEPTVATPAPARSTLRVRQPAPPKITTRS
jgi:ATP-binding cassette subfamily C protein LapB